ncbi:MAG: replication protein RepA [Nitrosospira sp.]
MARPKTSLIVSNRHRNLIEDALMIEQDETRMTDTRGYMASTLAQITLPHRRQKTLYYSRTNGKITLSVRGHEDYGVPFGSLPRTILAWMCTEAVRTKNPVLNLGNSTSDFVKNKLRVHYNGADLARVKTQALALSRAFISIDGKDGDIRAYENIVITSKGFVFWNDANPNQTGLWNSNLTLTEEFFQAATKHPIPIDFQIYHSLKQSPMAMDIYTWLTYRMFVLLVSGRTQAMIPWAALMLQLGAGYPDTPQGLRNFKKNFLYRLREVTSYWKDAQDHIESLPEHLKLTPCKLLIPHTGDAKLFVPK